MKLIVLTLILFSLTNNTYGLLLTTATVTEVQNAILSGATTCVQVVQGYLNRIRAYNQAGPMIGGVISLNPNAISEAVRLDNFCRQNRRLMGILHCAPLLLKDNIDAVGMATTAGVNALRNMCPLVDAETVRNARQAGAIVLGKANMSPFADTEAWGNSETGGLIRNPYGPNYTTYGSSGGSGASGAAMFSILGYGTETGVSVNLPSSAANLVGLRPPVALVSQHGVLPNSILQDVVGPMAKTVEDVALLLDAEVGNAVSKTYSAPNVLRTDGLQGARINIFKMFTYDEFTLPGLGTYRVDPQIVNMVNVMVNNMVNAGATVRNVTLDMNSAAQAISAMMTNATYDACLATWRNWYFGNPVRYGNQAPYHTMEDIVRSNTLPTYYQNIFIRVINASSFATCNLELQAYIRYRQQFISSVLTPLLNNADVAFWPTMPVFPPRLGDDALRREWNSSRTAINLISAGSWSAYPTLDLPIGFSQPLSDAPDGLPAGTIFISTPENLQTLLRIGYAYQKRFGISKVPYSTPELPSNY